MNITDDVRMKFIMKDIDSYFKVENDRHEYALGVAHEEGREVVTEKDELEGFRRMVDAAMVAHGFINK